MYPGWQLQRYLHVLTWSTRVPPFKQGLLEHSLRLRENHENEQKR